MECIVQYLDDLEDLIYAFALKWERIRGKLESQLSREQSGLPRFARRRCNLDSRIVQLQL